MSGPVLVFAVFLALVVPGFCLAVWGGSNYEARDSLTACAALSLGLVLGGLGCSVFLWLPKI